MISMRFAGIIPIAVALAVLAIMTTPAQVRAATTLKVVRGSGEFKTLEQAVTVSKPEAFDFQWTTDQTGAVGGTWKVTVAGSTTAVASGTVTPAPGIGKIGTFSIPANSFLKATPPATAVNYNVTISAYNKQNQPSGQPSAPVVVTQVADTPSPAPNFGPAATYPQVEFVSYREHTGQVQNTNSTIGVVTLRVFSDGKSTSSDGKNATDPVLLWVKDFNVLIGGDSPQKVDAFPKGVASSKTLTFTLNADLPATSSVVRAAQWQEKYREKCGVDLRVTLDWGGPKGSTPMNDHREIDIYVGQGNSPPALEGPDDPVCTTKQCVSTREIAKIIHRRLVGKVVGYALAIGHSPKLIFQACGRSRTAADPPAHDYATSTKMTIASSSKVITTLAAIKVLAKHNIALTAQIGDYLPKDWNVTDATMRSITFKELLSQTSGIKDYGNNRHTYAAVKAFFTQTVNPSGPKINCQKSNVVDPANPINRDGKPCYSNYNTAIMRILLPTMEGVADDDATLADKYVELVQKNVFEPVGVTDADCRPPAQNTAYALLYLMPGTAAGSDWKDQRTKCGAQGWYVSVEDISKVLGSLNANDGKILTTQQFKDMQSMHLGWDMTKSDDFNMGATSHSGYRYLEKNGGESTSNGVAITSTLWTSIAIIGGPSISTGDATAPNVLGALFINSDIPAEPGVDASTVLFQTYGKALKPKP